MKVLERSVTDLASTGILDGATGVGDVASTFTLPGADGKDVALAELLGAAHAGDIVANIRSLEEA